MKKFLIVNADDFGLCHEISSGIIKAFEDGIVTSTTVVALGSGFESGLPLLKDSKIDTGIHLSFVGGEKPLTGPIGGLVDDDGFFLKDYSSVVPKILFNRYDKKSLKRELVAQAERLKDSGLSITHMDAHQHLHILPGIKEILFHIAEQFNIKWIRVPHARKHTLKGLGLNFFSSILKSRLKNAGLNYPEHFEGFDFSGLATEKNISAVLERSRPGITELMVHPGHNASSTYGWDFKWEEELEALTSETIKKILKDNNITLTDYGALS